MKKYFRLVLGALTMFAVMLVAAALTLRVALHGREVSIPDFAGKTAAEASTAALDGGLDLTIANKFYSTTVPAGRMLSQAPAPGSRVRRGWQVRVTQSLGPQQVTIPDVAGEPVREATMELRRNSLDLGTVVHLEAPGEPDIVMAQTPPPNAGVDQPRVSLLLSSATNGASTAMVMPSFLGMSYGAANRLGTSLGLRVYYVADQPVATPPSDTATTIQSGTATQTPGSTETPTVSTPETPVAPSTPGGPVTAQRPEPGNRVYKGESVRIVFGHPATQASAPSTSTTTTVPAP